jgi:hypothetical protein
MVDVPERFAGKLVAPIRLGPAGSYAVFVQSAVAGKEGTKIMLAPRFALNIGQNVEATTGSTTFEGTGLSALPPFPSTFESEAVSGPSAGLIAGVVLGCLLAIGLVILGIVLNKRRKSAVSHEEHRPHTSKIEKFLSPEADGEYVELEGGVLPSGAVRGVEGI